MLNKLILIHFLFFLPFTRSFSQNFKSCQLVSKIINLEVVINFFRIDENKDSLILIDKQVNFPQNCNSLIWGINKISLTSDSALLNRAVLGESARFFKDECQYYVIDEFVQTGNKYSFTLYQACSNQFIKCKVTKKREKYKLTWHYAGVY